MGTEYINGQPFRHTCDRPRRNPETGESFPECGAFPLYADPDNGKPGHMSFWYYCAEHAPSGSRPCRIPRLAGDPPVDALPDPEREEKTSMESTTKEKTFDLHVTEREFHTIIAA